MARAKKHRATKVQGRISPTEALHILMDGGLSGYHAAARLDQAVKTNDCKLWHDGELMAPDYFARLLVIVARLEADDGWQAFVTGNPLRIMVPGKRWVFEFDADQVKALLSQRKPDTQPTRRKPGRKITGNWRLVAAHRMHTIREEELRTPTAKELCEHCAVTCGYAPDDSEMRDLMRFLINE